MSANKLTVTRHGNDVRITLPNGVEFMFHSGDQWAIGSENIAHKAMLCLFDRIATLEAEKDVNDAFRKEAAELRAKLTKAESTIAFEQKNLAHQSERMAELRAKLAEYEQAPTIMTRGDGLELIARTTRKGEA